MTEAILEMVQPRDLWIKDRNFCTTAFLFGIAKRGAAFVTRQHGSLGWEAVGKRVAKGRCETGEVFEQTIRLTNDEGEILFVRRVTVELDKETRDGDGTIHILTNLSKKEANAIKVADLYRNRWTLETAFQELEASLNGEINTLGYPKAALFAFCLALVSYNVLSTVKAALRSVHGEKASDTKVSGYDLAEEVAGTYRGMMIAVPKDEWVVFHEMSPQELSPFLKKLAGAVRLSEFRKQPRRPKKPRPERQTRGQDQTCGDCRAARKAEGQVAKKSKLVHNISSTQGWVGETHQNLRICRNPSGHLFQVVSPNRGQNHLLENHRRLPQASEGQSQRAARNPPFATRAARARRDCPVRPLL